MGFDELVQHDLSEMTTGIGNGLTGGNGSPVGIADGGVGNSELDNSDAFTFNGDLTLAQGSQDYTFKARSSTASLQGESSNSFAGLELIAGDADGSENLEFVAWGLKKNGISDRERIRFRYNSAFPRGEVQTEAEGTGSDFPLHLFAGGNGEQIIARTDGNVAMNNGLLVGSTGAATNALGVSGGAVVGSGYAGSNTAPTDGALFEGSVGFKTTSASGAATFDGSVFVKEGHPLTLGDTATENSGRFNANRLQLLDLEDASIEQARYNSLGLGVVHRVASSRSGTIGSAGTKLQSGDVMYQLEVIGDDGNDFANRAAQIRGVVDGAVSTDTVPGRIQLSTTTTGGSLNEALRIDSSQNTGLGGISPVNCLDVNGAAVIGSSFAGSNTAPTDGLLVEGSVGIKQTNPLNSLHVRGNPPEQVRIGASNSAGHFKLGVFPGGGGAGKSVLNAVDGTGAGNPKMLFQVGNTNYLSIESSGKVAVQPDTSRPGSLSNPAFQVGNGGAGIFVDSNGDLVARDGNGNTSVLT